MNKSSSYLLLYLKSYRLSQSKNHTDVLKNLADICLSKHKIEAGQIIRNVFLSQSTMNDLRYHIVNTLRSIEADFF